MSYSQGILLANPKNYGAIRSRSDIKYIVVHYTGNDGDRAWNNVSYFRDHIVKASAHYFVDDTSIWQSVPENYVSWSVGGKKYADVGKTGGGTLYGIVTNSNSINVELCDTSRNGTFEASKATVENACDLIRKLMQEYHIPVENVVRHFDVTGKHCPSYFMDSKKWNEFKRRLVSDNSASPAHKSDVDWAVEKGIIAGTTSGDLMLTQPVTRQQMCTMLHRFYKLIGGENHD